MLLGFLLLLMGCLMLLNQFGLLEGSLWQYFWPLVVIAFGVSIIIKHSRKSP